MITYDLLASLMYSFIWLTGLASVALLATKMIRTARHNATIRATRRHYAYAAAMRRHPAYAVANHQHAA